MPLNADAGCHSFFPPQSFRGCYFCHEGASNGYFFQWGFTFLVGEAVRARRAPQNCVFRRPPWSVLYITKRNDPPSITNDYRQATATKKDLEALPTPEHITLLLKNHKQTVLLSVMPTTPFAEIRSLLLAALQSRNITSIDGAPLPDEPEEIEFGVLRNKRNPAEGWVPLDVKEMEVGDARGGKRKVGGKQSVLNESPAGASLGDGSMLAFRFRAQGKKSVLNEGFAGASLGDESILAFRFQTQGKEDAPEDDDNVEIEDDPGWNVILPSYDDEE
jgi:hypothetical protein